MSLTVGFPPGHARIPAAWGERLSGMEARSGSTVQELLDRLHAGELDAVAVATEETGPGGLPTDRAGLWLGATPQRAEPRDLLVPAEGAPTLTTLPEGARVALAGRRRRALLAVHRPDLAPVELPGDPERTVGPFLRGGGADAAILAAHVARSTGLSDAASQVLDPKAWLPAPGQGSWALLVRKGDVATRDVLGVLDDRSTRAALDAEAALVRALGMETDPVLGALALPYGRWLRLWAMIPDPDGRRVVRGDLSGSDREPRALGRRMARLLRERGADLLPGAPTAAGRTPPPHPGPDR